MTSQGRYTILGEIAAGGTATVFLAEDNVLRRKVALKKMHPHLHRHTEMVKRFEKEAVAVASLSHENVIKIFDFGREDNSLFLAMEYVDGASLDSILREEGSTVPNLAALSLFHQLMEGLMAAHTMGIFHRDIKPSNVLIDNKGCVRIVDFGIAFLSEETSITRTGSYLGTPGYSAPEQAEGRPVTRKTDIFAAGTLLYRCLTGQMPFTGDSPHAVLKAIVEKNQVKANLVNPLILPELADLVQEMLSKEPSCRPEADACVLRLEAILSGLGFPLDPNRVQRLLSDPIGAAEKERKDLSARLSHQARVLDKLGKSREAMKRFSLAEVFAEKGGETEREAARYRKSLRSKARRAGIAGVAVLFALGLWLSESRGPGPAPARPGRVEMPRPVPVAFSTEIALPTAIPAWPSGTRGNGAVTHRRVPPAARPMPGPSPESPPGAEPAPAQSGILTASGSARGFFRIKTNPPFARVSIDGKVVGSTPIDSPLPLDAGTHVLDIAREGCRKASQVLRISAGDTALVRLTLDRADSAP